MMYLRQTRTEIVRRGTCVLSIALALTSACASDSPSASDDTGVDAGGNPTDADAGLADAGSCTPVVLEHDRVPGSHVGVGTEIAWPTNPPNSGDHFSLWGGWNLSFVDPPLARGHWVHNLEHGGVALLHNCPGGCAEELAALETFMSSLDADPICEAPVKNRILITADPLLPVGVRFAAAAWGATYTADCLDLSSLRDFVAKYYGNGPEAECDDGAVRSGL